MTTAVVFDLDGTLADTTPVERSAVHGDAVETLAALAERGAALGVCAKKTTELSWSVLRCLGLAEHIGAVVGADAVPHRKPDPRRLEAVLDALDASPEDAVYVGDNVVDVRTAEAAGVRCAFVNWGTAPVTEEPTWARIDRFHDLVALLEDGDRAGPRRGEEQERWG